MDLSLDERSCHWFGHPSFKLGKPYCEFERSVEPQILQFYNRLAQTFKKCEITENVSSQIFAHEFRNSKDSYTTVPFTVKIVQ